MPSFTLFGIKVDGNQTMSEQCNKEALDIVVRGLLSHSTIEKVVIKKNWV